MRDPQFEENVRTWEDYHRKAETSEERLSIQKLARSAGQRIEEICGFLRTTYLP